MSAAPRRDRSFQDNERHGVAGCTGCANWQSLTESFRQTTGDPTEKASSDVIWSQRPTCPASTRTVQVESVCTRSNWAQKRLPLQLILRPLQSCPAHSVDRMQTFIQQEAVTACTHAYYQCYLIPSGGEVRRKRTLNIKPNTKPQKHF